MASSLIQTNQEAIRRLRELADALEQGKTSLVGLEVKEQIEYTHGGGELYRHIDTHVQTLWWPEAKA